MKLLNKKYLLISIIVILILCGLFYYYFVKKENPAPINQNSNNQSNNLNKADTSKRTDYSNGQLGFSIKIPTEVPTLYRCPNKQTGNTPIDVFEDNQNGYIYISPKYYYDANWSQADQKYIGDCSKITYSLESLKEEEKANNLTTLASYPFLGWKIIINNLKDEGELAGYIKQNFGQTCTIESKELQENGNYAITFKGRKIVKDGQGLMDETCYNNFAYKIIYSPEKHKLMSVILGQECTFGTDPSSPTYKCYDDEMIKSFKFN